MTTTNVQELSHAAKGRKNAPTKPAPPTATAHGSGPSTLLQPVLNNSGEFSPAQASYLQRTMGNAAVGRILQASAPARVQRAPMTTRPSQIAARVTQRVPAVIQRSDETPLGEEDAFDAQQKMHGAALKVLLDVAVENNVDTDAGAVKELADRWRLLLTQARPPDSSLLGDLSGESARTKALLSKSWKEDFAAQIVEAVGAPKLKPAKVAKKIQFEFVVLTNNSAWNAFEKRMVFGGQGYRSKFTPLNQAFDTKMGTNTFGQYGTTGYSSMTPKMSKEEMPTGRSRLINGWMTEFSKDGSVSADPLFSAFRSGVLTERGIKDDDERATAARGKAWELLQAMAIAYVKSSRYRPSSHTEGTNPGEPVTIPVVTTGLLTGVVGKFGDAKMINEHRAALEHWQNAGPQQVDLGTRQVWVRFNIMNFNFAVNAGRRLDTSSQSINNASIEKLGVLKDETLLALGDELNNSRLEVARLQQARFINARSRMRIQDLTNKNKKILTDMAKIKQLWALVTAERKKHRREPYRMPALISNLGHLLGAMVHYNCMSGKDRTGMTDSESKFMAFQMDDMVSQQIENMEDSDAWANQTGSSEDIGPVLPEYKSVMSNTHSEAGMKMIFQSGNLEIQKLNTQFGGYKNQDMVKRLETMVAPGSGGRTEVERITGQDFTNLRAIDVAKKVAKMLAGFSGFTAA